MKLVCRNPKCESTAESMCPVRNVYGIKGYQCLDCGYYVGMKHIDPDRVPKKPESNNKVRGYHDIESKNTIRGFRNISTKMER